ncbi:MAG: outer membrane lipoprotein carrier protein LolA [Oligoflexia bacterium]|nr:outer membrane lipoprotein carrier protein LolA [Oligoflexia bacterium]
MKKHLIKYQQIKTLFVKFEQTKKVKSLGVEIKSQGNMTVRHPDFILWKITAPSEMSVTMSGSNVIIVSKNFEGKELIQKYNFQNMLSDRTSKSMLYLTKWLQLDAKFIADNYTIYELEKNHYQFHPKQKEESPFSELEIQVSKRGDVSKLILKEINDDEIYFTFESPVLNKDKR